MNLAAVLFKHALIIFYYYCTCLVAVNTIVLITLHVTAFYSFTLLTAVHGYHVYHIWRLEIGDQFYCEREGRNSHRTLLSTVAVKDDAAVQLAMF